MARLPSFRSFSAIADVEVVESPSCFEAFAASFAAFFAALFCCRIGTVIPVFCRTGAMYGFLAGFELAIPSSVNFFRRPSRGRLRTRHTARLP